MQILVTLLLGLPSPSHGASACSTAATAFQNCTQVSGANTDDGDPATRVMELVASYNAASPFSYECKRTGAAAAEACGADSREWAEAHRRLIRNANSLPRLRQSWIDKANEIGRDANLWVTCVRTDVNHFPADPCFVLDVTRPHTRIIDRPNAGALPLTVGISGRCTFTVDPRGRLITADHCGETLSHGGWILGTLGDQRVTAEPAARLEYTDTRAPEQYSLTNILKYSGAHARLDRAFADLSIWTTNEVPRGRAFYVLAEDDARTDGCEVENDLYLACAPNVFPRLQGKRAHAIGFPTARYSKRDRAETVVVSDGDLYFEGLGERLLLHAAVSPGSSGGPVYLDAGERIGGVVLDRPLYLGPISGFAPEDHVSSVSQNDVLAIVGIYDLAHVRGVLTAF